MAEPSRKRVYHHHPTSSLVTVHHLADEVFVVDRFGTLWIALARDYDGARDAVDIHMNRQLMKQGETGV